MKEIVVISGKGGTGKTSIVASLAILAKPAVLVDCDVDAADLHLLLEPDVLRRENFVAGSKARIKPGHCTACGKCEELCRFDAIYYDGPGNGRVSKTYRIDPLACEGCGVCFDFCAEQAIEFMPETCGQWFESRTRAGPMVHARLAVAAENSGKLVTQLRRTSQEVAKSQGLGLVICDGSPGIGCPVIASLTGASLALIVVEPTMSGLHDFSRIAQLASRLAVPSMMVVNKADLNPKVADQLETEAKKHAVEPIGRVPYDPAITQAQVAKKSIVEFGDGPAAQAIRDLWDRVADRLPSFATAQAGGLMQIDV
jgi:MinD superfamily P-loop ATPase